MIFPHLSKFYLVIYVVVTKWAEIIFEKEAKFVGCKMPLFAHFQKCRVFSTKNGKLSDMESTFSR